MGLMDKAMDKAMAKLDDRFGSLVEILERIDRRLAAVEENTRQMKERMLPRSSGGEKW